jgi:hypothetical protein
MQSRLREALPLGYLRTAGPGVGSRAERASLAAHNERLFSHKPPSLRWFPAGLERYARCRRRKEELGELVHDFGEVLGCVSEVPARQKTSATAIAFRRPARTRPLAPAGRRSGSVYCANGTSPRWPGSRALGRRCTPSGGDLAVVIGAMMIAPRLRAEHARARPASRSPHPDRGATLCRQSVRAGSRPSRRVSADVGNPTPEPRFRVPRRR